MDYPLERKGKELSKSWELDWPDNRYQNFDEFGVFRIEFFIEDDGLFDKRIFNAYHVEYGSLKFSTNTSFQI